MFNLFHKKDGKTSGNPTISAQSNDSTSLGDDVEDELKAKNLIHFVNRNESDENEICINVHENECWHPILHTWGSVEGVHLGKVFDRAHFTDENGSKHISGSLEEIKPITGYRWKGADWSVYIDVNTTDLNGYQYAHNWRLLHDECKPSIVENSVSLVRRRKWRRVMVKDQSTPVKSLPYELNLKIKRANILIGGNTSHCYIETYLDGKLYDTTLCGPPEWNKNINIKLMYLKPDLKISFLLYMKRFIPSLINTNTTENNSSLKGVVHFDLSTIINMLNSPMRDVDYQMMSKETYQKVAYLTVGTELKESRLFSIISGQSDGFKALRFITQEAISVSLKEKISVLDNIRYSLLNNVTKLLIENFNNLLYELDIELLLNDLLLMLNDPACVHSPNTNMALKNRENTTMAMIMKELTLSNNNACFYPPVAFQYNSIACCNWHHSEIDPKNPIFTAIRAHNLEIYQQKQPVCSSIYNLTTSCGYFAKPSRGYELLVLMTDGNQYSLLFSEYNDYINILMLLSVVTYAHVYAYAANNTTVSKNLTYTCEAEYSNLSPDATQLQQQIAVKVTVDGAEAQCLLIDEIVVGNSSNNWSKEGATELLLPFEEISCVTARSLPCLEPAQSLVQVTLVSASSSHLTHTHSTCRVDIQSTDGRTQCSSGAGSSTNRHCVTSNDISTLLFKETTLNILVNDADTHVTVTLHTDAATYNSDLAGFKSKSVTVPAVNSTAYLPLPTGIITENKPVNQQLFFFNGTVPYVLQLSIPKFEKLWAADSSTGTSDPYYVVYLADGDGQIIPCTNNSSNILTSGAKTLVKGVVAVANVTKNINNNDKNNSNNANNNTSDTKDYLYKSRVIDKCCSPVFNDLISISTDKFATPLSTAKFIYIEIFDKNITRSDISLGEVYIPIVTATDISHNKSLNNNDLKTKHKQFIIQPSKSMVNKSQKYIVEKSNNSNINNNINSNGSIKSLGVLHAELTIEYTNTNQTAQQIAHHSAGQDDIILLRTVVTKRPVQISDCFWPAHAFSDSNGSNKSNISNNNSNNSGVDINFFIPPDSFSILVRDEGLYVYSNPTFLTQLKHSSANHSDYQRMLTECLEYSYTTASNQHLFIVPYSQINASSMNILTFDNLFLTLQLQRKLPDKKVDKKKSDYNLYIPAPVIKPIELSLIISPCMAEQMYVTINNHIALANYRSEIKHLLALPVNLNNDSNSGTNNNSTNNNSTNNSVGLSDATAYDTLLSSLQRDVYALANDIQTVTLRIQQQEEEDGSGKSDPSKPSDSDESVMTRHVGKRPSTQNDKADAAAKSDLFARYHHSVCNSTFNHFLLLRILILRKTSTQLYFWFVFDRMVNQKQRIYATKSFINVSKTNNSNNSNNSDKNDSPLALTYTTDYINTLTEKVKNVLQIDNNVNSTSTIENSDASLVTILQNVMVELNQHIKACVLECCAVSVAYSCNSSGNCDISLVTKNNNNNNNNSNNNNESITVFENVEIRKLLTKLIYDQYLVVVNYITHILIDDEDNILVTHRKFYDSESAKQADELKKHSSIQRKRDLISFIVTQDNLFIDTLEPTLHSFCYKFDVKPVLSIVVDFDTLIEKWSNQLNENIKSWNSKTLTHFMTHKGEINDDGGTGNNSVSSSGSSLIPWDITTLSDRKNNKEYYISHIPETIQTQLNIQIGLKKISLRNNIYSCNLSIQSIKRIHLINKQVSGAIANAYVQLAVEYEHFLHQLLFGTTLSANTSSGNTDNLVIGGGKLLAIPFIQLSGLLSTMKNNIESSIQQNNNTDGAEDSLSPLSPVTTKTTSSSNSNTDGNSSNNADSTSDDVMCFLFSIVNDCHRIANAHIPDSIEAFTSDFSDDMAQYGHSPDVSSSKKLEIVALYKRSINSIDSVAVHTLNYLANQILFGNELKKYFLTSFDAFILYGGKYTADNDSMFAIPLPLLNLLKRVKHSVTGNSNNSGDNANNTDKEVVYSPTDIICATLQAFYEYAAQHMYADDLNRLILACLKKLTIRYLVCLRDVTARLGRVRKRDIVKAILFQNPVMVNTSNAFTQGISGLNTGIVGFTDGISTFKDNVTDFTSTIGRTFTRNNALGASNGGVNAGLDSDDDDYVVQPGESKLLTTELDSIKIHMPSEDETASAVSTTHYLSTKTVASFAESVNQSNKIQDDYDNAYLSPVQCGLIKADLTTLLTSYMAVQYDQVTDLLRFLNTEVVNILSGGDNCDAAQITNIIIGQFNISPPSFIPTTNTPIEMPLSYQREMEDFLSLHTFFNDKPSGEVYAAQQRKHTIQLSDFELINLKDFKLCVVRVSVDGAATYQETAALSSVHKTLKWNDVLFFSNVMGFESKSLLIQIVEKRPIGIFSEYVHCSIKVSLSRLFAGDISISKVVTSWFTLESANPAAGSASTANNSTSGSDSKHQHSFGRQRTNSLVSATPKESYSGPQLLAKISVFPMITGNNV